MDQKNNGQSRIEFEWVYTDGFTSASETSTHYSEKDGQCIQSDGFDPGIEVESLAQQSEQNVTLLDSRAIAQSPINEGNKTNEVNSKPAEKNEIRRAERLNKEKPFTEEPIQENTDKSTLDNFEKGIDTINIDTQKGIQSLKSDLEDYTQDGGNWLVAGLAATAFDIMGGATSLIAGYSKGMLDTRNIGEGMAKGTLDGVMEDLSRLSNILPQGKVLTAIDRAMVAYDTVKTLEYGITNSDPLSITHGGFGILTHLAGRKHGGKSKTNKKGYQIIQELSDKKSKTIKLDVVFSGGKSISKRVPKKEIKKLMKRSAEINRSIVGKENSFVTVSAFLIYDKKTNKYSRAFSTNDKKLRDKFSAQLKKNEIALPGIKKKYQNDNLHHAETNGITSIWGINEGGSNGVVLVIPSNKACCKNLHNCSSMMDSYGITYLAPKDVLNY